VVKLAWNGTWSAAVAGLTAEINTAKQARTSGIRRNPRCKAERFIKFLGIGVVVVDLNKFIVDLFLFSRRLTL